MPIDNTDLTKFPIVAREPLVVEQTTGNSILVENKLPLSDSPYGSRLKNNIALPLTERDQTKNYLLLGFAPQRGLQAEDLNEIQEKIAVDNTLTQQMWSNWNSYNNISVSSFGPGWFGATPLYPHEWKSRNRFLDELVYADSNQNDELYEKPKNLVILSYTELTSTPTEPFIQTEYDMQLTLNPGWYYIEDTYTTNSTHDSSGLKYWYYLKEAVHSQRISLTISYDTSNSTYTIFTDSDEVFVDSNDPTNTHIPFGISLGDINYVSGIDFQSGADNTVGADRVEIVAKPKLGTGLTTERTPSYTGYVSFILPDIAEGETVTKVGEIQAHYLNDVPLDVASLASILVSEFSDPTEDFV